MGSAVPYRIDLFDDEIESIRSFDVDTQRSIYKVNEVRLLPAREFPMDEAAQNAFPPQLPRAVRRRSFALARLQGRLQRHPDRGHRVLPAALLRAAPRSSPITCPSARRSASYPGARSRRSTRSGSDTQQPLRDAARRSRQSRAAAAGAVPDRRTSSSARSSPIRASSSRARAASAERRRRRARSGTDPAPPADRTERQARRRCRRSPSSAAPTIRCTACARSSSASTAACCCSPKARAGARRCTSTSPSTGCRPQPRRELSRSSSRRPTS